VARAMTIRDRVKRKERRQGGASGDDAPLLTAVEVGAYLRVPPKKVYGLPIPRVRVSSRRVRWLASDVRAFTNGRRVE
jgi:hypothetical protein